MDLRIAVPVAAIAISLILVVASRVHRRRRQKHAYVLHNPLMLAAGPDLTIDDQTVYVDAGSPYRVVSVGKWTVIIEVQLPDGSTVQGYTTKVHVRT